ncbi:hypothetical protein R3W88_016117 [Solanum pinnatisectum]|uniref:Uncharacterized protein n=1 Tax=Solanum pinnatisectum TaxID=50273 RepID=A0AAV9KWY6_9SOLN|nr:hypothetical protein R3W88_016117 [Solanum pinnatisectum]
MKEKNESFLIFFPEKERERGYYGGRGREKSTYVLCSSSLIRKKALGWGSTM